MSTNANDIFVSKPGEGRFYNVLGARIAVRSSGREDQMMFVDHPVPAGFGVPLHMHHDEDEMIFVLDGTVTFVTEQGEVEAGPGTFLHLPRGVAHGFVNRSGADAHIVAAISPGGGLEGIFRDLDRMDHSAGPDPQAIARVLDHNRAALLAA